MAERVNIEGLRYAREVADTDSFSAAARAYGVTQPALSNGIAKLEEHLGDRLFERSTRGVTLTSFGVRMLPHINAALEALDGVSAEARRWTAPAEKYLRMGVSPLINPKLVAKAYRSVDELKAAAKPSGLVLREANLAELREALLVDELDLIVIPSVAPLPRYEHRVIDSEPIVLIDPDARNEEPVELAELAERELILVPDTCGLTTFTRDLLASRDLAVRPYPGEALSYRVLEEWSSLGMGSALLPLSKITNATALHRRVHDDGVEIEIFYEAVWNPHSALAAEVSALVGLLQGRADD